MEKKEPNDIPTTDERYICIYPWISLLTQNYPCWWNLWLHWSRSDFVDFQLGGVICNICFVLSCCVCRVNVYICKFDPGRRSWITLRGDDVRITRREEDGGKERRCQSHWSHGLMSIINSRSAGKCRSWKKYVGSISTESLTRRSDQLVQAILEGLKNNPEAYTVETINIDW